MSHKICVLRLPKHLFVLMSEPLLLKEMFFCMMRKKLTFLCSAKLNMGALSEKPLNSSFIGSSLVLYWGKNNKTRVRREADVVDLKGTWGMRFAKPSGHQFKQDWLQHALTERRRRQKLARAWGSLLPWLEQLLLSHSICPPGANSEVTVLGRRLTNSKVGGAFHQTPAGQHLPLSAVIIDLPALSTDHRSLGHEEQVSTIVLNSQDLCLEPLLITQMDKQVKDPLCVMVASLGRRWFCFAVWFCFVLFCFYVCDYARIWGTQ